MVALGYYSTYFRGPDSSCFLAACGGFGLLFNNFLGSGMRLRIEFPWDCCGLEGCADRVYNYAPAGIL